MSNATNRPIIIKRKKVVAGDGHHGGAWKVAYADFVTAMMAFFMLMWLLNATTEQQRRGIADYFSPTIPIAKISGGGAGAFGGEDISAEDILIHQKQGASAFERGAETGQNAHETAMVAALRAVEEELLGRGGESLVSEQAMRHVVSKITDEGLIIELFDLPDRSLFAPGTATPDPILSELAGVLARVFGKVDNRVAITGHSRAWPKPLRDDPSWDLTLGRATLFRDMMFEKGLSRGRLFRLTGHADTQLTDPDPFAARNNRLEVTLLRHDAD